MNETNDMIENSYILGKDLKSNKQIRKHFDNKRLINKFGEDLHYSLIAYIILMMYCGEK